MAIFSHDNVEQNNEFICQQEEIYRKHLPEWIESHYHVSDQRSNLEESGVELFTLPLKKIYYWEKKYTANEYANLLSTYSGHINLPQEKRNELLEDIRSLINNDFHGSISKQWKTELIIMKKLLN